MCVNSCIAFTATYEHYTVCPRCNEPRYDESVLKTSKGKKHVARKQTVSFPIGPQIQALRRSKSSSHAMDYRKRCTESLLLNENLGTISDFFHSDSYVEQVNAGNIGEHDVVVMLSIDGAQLYRYKKSDVWIWIWVIMDIAPDNRYRKKFVLPGSIAPGPNKIGNADSFLFRTLYHLCALMCDGFKYCIRKADKSFFVLF
jgi:hypothetical protein